MNKKKSDGKKNATTSKRKMTEQSAKEQKTKTSKSHDTGTPRKQLKQSNISSYMMKKNDLTTSEEINTQQSRSKESDQPQPPPPAPQQTTLRKTSLRKNTKQTREKSNHKKRQRTTDNTNVADEEDDGDDDEFQDIKSVSGEDVDDDDDEGEEPIEPVSKAKSGKKKTKSEQKKKRQKKGELEYHINDNQSLFYHTSNLGHQSIIWEPEILEVTFLDKNDLSFKNILNNFSCAVCKDVKQSASKYSVNALDSLVLDQGSICLINTGCGQQYAVHRAIDWCYTNDDDIKYAAIGTPDTSSSNHIIGKYYPKSRGFIQIWSFGKLTQKQMSKIDRPKLVLMIEHNHNFAWELKWLPLEAAADMKDFPSANCSNNGSSEPTLRRLGVLCAAFADGTICVMCIPRPEDVYRQYFKSIDGQNQTISDIPIIKLKSIAEIVQSEHIPSSTNAMNRAGYEDNDASMIGEEEEEEEQHLLGSEQYQNNGHLLTYSLAWSRDARFLATGTHEGSIHVWKVDTSKVGKDMLTPICSVQGHYHTMSSGAIRGIAWCWKEPNLFVTCGTDGHCKVWDVRDMCEPLADHAYSRLWQVDVEWPVSTSSYMMASHEGCIRQMDAKELCCTRIKVTDYPICSVCASPSNGFICYACSDGVVGLCSVFEDGIVKVDRQKPSVDAEIIKSFISKVSGDQETPQQQNDLFTLCFPQSTHLKAEGESGIVIKVAEDNKQKKGKKAEKKNQKIIPDNRLSWTRCTAMPSIHPDLRNWVLISGLTGLVVALKVPTKYQM